MKSELSGYAQYIGLTCIAGFAFCLLGQSLYPFLTKILWPPAGIALYFLLFAIVVFVAMRILNRLRGRGDSTQDNSYMQRRAYRNCLIYLLAIFLAVGFFEFLYEPGGEQPEPSSSYVFLIDDSRSMADNDPTLRRIEAINTIMSKRPANFPYAVYGFTEDATLVKPMAPYNSKESLAFESNGNTDLLNSLNTVLAHLSNGSLQGGTTPRILLLSDGASSDVGWLELTQECLKNNVIVSCIGFGYECDLLQGIADRTGGVFIQVDDIDLLAEKMEKAITSSADRDLVSYRATVDMDRLYAILRVLFLCVIGFFWSQMKYEAFCSTSAEANDRVFRLSLATCAVSSVLFEITLQQFWVSPFFARMFLCVMWALTPGTTAANKSLDLGSNARVIDEE